VYSFNATITRNADRRQRKEVEVSADAATLDKAWDKAERKAAHLFPDHTVILSVGNRMTG
jgi:hypothetical protein